MQTKIEVAIKLEPVKSRHPQLSYEYRLYRILQGKVGPRLNIPSTMRAHYRPPICLLVLPIACSAQFSR